MNARELHGHFVSMSEERIRDNAGTILRALDLLARTEESTDELVRELHAFRESAKPFPSGAGGQQCGMESYRIVASGNQLEVIYTAAAAIVALNENCAMLKRTVENQDAYIVALKAERDSLKAHAEAMADALEEAKRLGWHHRALDAYRAACAPK